MDGDVPNGCPVVQAYTFHRMSVSYSKIYELCNVTQNPAVEPLEELNCNDVDEACRSNCWMKEPWKSEQ